MRHRFFILNVFLLVIGLAAFAGYFFGFQNAKREIGRNYSAGTLMFFTGIHEHLSRGDVESAKKVSGAGASCQILALQALASEPIMLQFWSMFPYPGMPDMKAYRESKLIQAYDHFSKDQKAIGPEAMTYLEKTKIVEK